MHWRRCRRCRSLRCAVLILGTWDGLRMLHASPSGSSDSSISLRSGGLCFARCCRTWPLLLRRWRFLHRWAASATWSTYLLSLQCFSLFLLPDAGRLRNTRGPLVCIFPLCPQVPLLALSHLSMLRNRDLISHFNIDASLYNALHLNYLTASVPLFSLYEVGCNLRSIAC